MKTSQDYFYIVKNLFRLYQNLELSENSLISILFSIERHEQDLNFRQDHSLCFRFKDMPLIYTIRDLENDLSGKHKGNKDLLINCFIETINDDRYLEISYS